MNYEEREKKLLIAADITLDLPSLVGKTVEIRDTRFGKRFASRIESVEFSPRDPHQVEQGQPPPAFDFLTFTVAAARVWDGKPEIMLKLGDDGRAIWDVRFNRYGSADYLRVYFLL